MKCFVFFQTRKKHICPYGSGPQKFCPAFQSKQILSFSTTPSAKSPSFPADFSTPNPQASYDVDTLLKKGSVFTLENRNRFFQKISTNPKNSVGIWRLRGFRCRLLCSDGGFALKPKPSARSERVEKPPGLGAAMPGPRLRRLGATEKGFSDETRAIL